MNPIKFLTKYDVVGRYKLKLGYHRGLILYSLEECDLIHKRFNLYGQMQTFVMIHDT